MDEAVRTIDQQLAALESIVYVIAQSMRVGGPARGGEDVRPNGLLAAAGRRAFENGKAAVLVRCKEGASELDVARAHELAAFVKEYCGIATRVLGPFRELCNQREQAPSRGKRPPMEEEEEEEEEAALQATVRHLGLQPKFAQAVLPILDGLVAAQDDVRATLRVYADADAFGARLERAWGSLRANARGAKQLLARLAQVSRERFVCVVAAYFENLDTAVEDAVYAYAGGGGGGGGALMGKHLNALAMTAAAFAERLRNWHDCVVQSDVNYHKAADWRDAPPLRPHAAPAEGRKGLSDRMKGLAAFPARSTESPVPESLDPPVPESPVPESSVPESPVPDTPATGTGACVAADGGEVARPLCAFVSTLAAAAAVLSARLWIRDVTSATVGSGHGATAPAPAVTDGDGLRISKPSVARTVEAFWLAAIVGRKPTLADAQMRTALTELERDLAEALVRAPAAALVAVGARRSLSSSNSHAPPVATEPTAARSAAPNALAPPDEPAPPAGAACVSGESASGESASASGGSASHTTANPGDAPPRVACALCDREVPPSECSRVVGPDARRNRVGDRWLHVMPRRKHSDSMRLSGSDGVEDADANGRAAREQKGGTWAADAWERGAVFVVRRPDCAAWLRQYRPHRHGACGMPVCRACWLAVAPSLSTAAVYMEAPAEHGPQLSTPSAHDPQLDPSPAARGTGAAATVPLDSLQGTTTASPNIRNIAGKSWDAARSYARAFVNEFKS